MKSLSVNVAENILADVDQAIKFIDKLVEKLEDSCRILRERMKMRREGWNKKERGDFNKFKTELALLAIDVHQNEVAMKRTTNKNILVISRTVDPSALETVTVERVITNMLFGANQSRSHESEKSAKVITGRRSV